MTRAPTLEPYLTRLARRVDETATVYRCQSRSSAVPTYELWDDRGYVSLGTSFTAVRAALRALQSKAGTP